jgi:hypothetical protein
MEGVGSLVVRVTFEVAPFSFSHSASFSVQLSLRVRLALQAPAHPAHPATPLSPFSPPLPLLPPDLPPSPFATMANDPSREDAKDDSATAILRPKKSCVRSSPSRRSHRPLTSPLPRLPVLPSLSAHPDSIQP